MTVYIKMHVYTRCRWRITMNRDEYAAIVEKAKLDKSRRWAILDYLHDYSHDFPWLPDTREMVEDLGISSSSVVNYNLDPMLEAGLLACLVLPSGRAAPRTIHLTDLGREVLAQFKKYNSKNE